MLIRFAKHANRPATLNCLRDDGSATWFTASPANADFFVYHDLLHYAVEATLGYSTAFFGLVAAGRDLNDFGSEEGTPDVRAYSVEANDTERLVGLIQTVSSQGVPPSYEALCEAWSSSTNGDSSERPPIDEAQLATICAVWQNLTQRWKATEVNHTLELAFPREESAQPTA